MKTLKYLTVLALLTFQMTTYAQNSENPDEKTLREELILLNNAIDTHFDQMVAFKAALDSKGLTLDSPKESMSGEMITTFEILEAQRAELITFLSNYRFIIEDALEKTTDPAAKDVLKSLYNIALVKSFLPRYEVAKTNIITKLSRIFTPNKAYYVEEIITRNAALGLFFTDFENGNEVRFKEVLKIYNTIASNYNKERGSVLLVVQPTSIPVTSTKEEASFYNALIRGEEIKPLVEPKAVDVAPTSEKIAEKASDKNFTLNKVDGEHFELTFNCSSLFN